MKLITWNIQWCRGLDGNVDPERIVSHARRLADFDVLCLQEVAANFPELAGSTGENQYTRLAELLPDYTAVPGVAIDVQGAAGERKVFGNMLFSRYPVLSVARLQLPSPPEAGRPSMPRMLIDATLQAPFGVVRVMTSHLEYFSARQRAAQVEAILQRHAEACAWVDQRSRDSRSKGAFKRPPQTRSAILTADFNFRADDPLHARLRSDNADASRFVDVWQHAHPGEAQPPTLGMHDRKRWPEPLVSDFIYATADLLPRLRAVTVDQKTQASDHQPVLAIFE